ncbi:caspase family protein [Sulfurovum sp. bin170]|uniref:caspase family protein n=1 Tax=Sulfurovum sp. bin170 TaxID=2695268 RepID=UPI0013DFBB96|nr:caspase family protein [Sulfurovum sp. bin170]NEW59926.1 caspase family protein [Sulfurovum sp. bin170]
MYKNIILFLLLLFPLISQAETTRAVEVVDGDTQTYPRIALVIGNNNYERGNTLVNAVSDARAMRDFLRDRDFRVVYAEDADIATMREKVDEFMAGLSKKSVAVIYYSGHASQDKSRMYNGEMTNYLIPIDNARLTTITDHDRMALSLNYLLSKADEINHGLNIAMLDACRTSIGKGSRPIKNFGATGVYLVYATASGVTASDNGRFRESFLKHANNSLKLSDIFLKVKQDLRNMAQRPSMIDDTNGEPFFFTQPSQSISTPIVEPQVVYRDRPQEVISVPAPIVVAQTYSDKWITPTESICSSNGGKINKNGICEAEWNNANKICKASGGVLPNIETLRAVVTDCGGVIDECENKNNKFYQACSKERGFNLTDLYLSSTNPETLKNGESSLSFDCGGSLPYWLLPESGVIRCVRGGQ